ncbi:peptide synthase, partial [Pseudoalteromonas maricaloris]
PSAYMILEALPLTANGKVNVKALPEPDIGLSRAEYVAPKSDTERALCSIWQQVLEVERVGIMDNFFELGGNSLLFVKLLTAIEQEFEIKLAVSHVFMLDNLKSLALHLDAVAGNANCDEQEQDLDFFEI